MILHRSITDHWHCQYEDLQLSSNEFYTALEEELKDKAYPEVTYERKELRERGFLSGKRTYFVVSRDEYKFVICAAPFGKSFFFSWYLEEFLTLGAYLGFIPFIGKWIVEYSRSKSYFEADGEIMFKESIKGIVKKLLAEVEQQKGLRDTALA